MHSVPLILGLTTGASLAVGILAALGLHRLRSRSLRVLLTVTALAPMLAVAASVVVNVEAMFISGHDSTVVLIALACAVPIAVGLATVAGRQVAAGASAVAEGVRRFESGAATGERPGEEKSLAPAPVPAELAALAAELEQVRLRLAESRRREADLEQARRELIAFLSHDLRTPLAGLRALGEALEDGVIDDVPQALKRMLGAVDRMGTLVNDLFELSRLAAPHPPARGHEPVSLVELAADAVGESREHARARGVDLRLETADPADPLPVRGAGDQLTRALGNLVTNAVRHTRSGGRVLVRADRGGDGEIRLAVTDQCGGIPFEHLNRVFDTGWRGSPARSDDGGAGLGLAIVAAVARAHAGRVDVHNLDDGCRFELTLPSENAPRTA